MEKALSFSGGGGLPLHGADRMHHEGEQVMRSFWGRYRWCEAGLIDWGREGALSRRELMLRGASD